MMWPIRLVLCVWGEVVCLRVLGINAVGLNCFARTIGCRYHRFVRRGGFVRCRLRLVIRIGCRDTLGRRGRAWLGFNAGQRNAEKIGIALHRLQEIPRAVKGLEISGLNGTQLGWRQRDPKRHLRKVFALLFPGGFQSAGDRLDLLLVKLG